MMHAKISEGKFDKKQDIYSLKVFSHKILTNYKVKNSRSLAGTI